MIECPVCEGTHANNSNCQRIDSINKLNAYVDTCIIDEYAIKDFEDGYMLDVDNLSKYEIANFLNELMQHDTSVKDYVLSEMQKLINKRLPVCQQKDREAYGFTSWMNEETGEINWERARIF